jgi:hypothetical protein
MRFGQRSACGSSDLRVSRIPAWVASLAMIALLSSSLTAQDDSVHGKNTHLVGRVLAGFQASQWALVSGRNVRPSSLEWNPPMAKETKATLSPRRCWLK